MAVEDSELSGLTANNLPEARDLLYHVDLSEATEADRSKSVTLESFLNSVVILYDEVVVLDGNIVTL